LKSVSPILLLRKDILSGEIAAAIGRKDHEKTAGPDGAWRGYAKDMEESKTRPNRELNPF